MRLPGRPICWKLDYTWHQYKDTFDIVVSAKYVLNYEANGDNVTNMPSATTKTVADTKADLTVTSVKPTLRFHAVP